MRLQLHQVNCKSRVCKDEVEVVKGDVNLNGKVEIGDVREALRSICKKTQLTETQKQAGDITKTELLISKT